MLVPMNVLVYGGLDNYSGNISVCVPFGVLEGGVFVS